VSLASVPAASPRVAASLDVAELASGVLAGNRTALSRAITLVESNAPRHRAPAREILSRIAHRRSAARRIGVSGVPGAGKSTFIETFGNFLCDQGHRVAVLAVDPSSSLSGGSILGDKTRMETLCRRPESFIRPSPSGGALGGVTRKTRETIRLCEAAGYDILLVETVGVGQSEIDVRSMVDCFVLLMLAGAGDELQGIKKGIIEIADLLLVNKADGENLPRARTTRAELDRVVAFLTPVTEGWRPPVLAISARERAGLAETWEALQRFFVHGRENGGLDARRRRQAIEWWRALVDQELRSRVFARPEVAAHAALLEREIDRGIKEPSLAAEEFLSTFAPR
jgi:LAO/AO transport system kinase